MTAPLPTTCLGSVSPGGDRAVVLLHSAGVGASSMAPLARLLAAAGRCVVAVHRPGYGDAADRAAMPVPAQAAATLGALEGLGLDRVDLLGVSAGATVGLQIAMLAPDRLGRVVLHEPLVGPTAPSLHAQIGKAISAMGADPSEDAVGRFLRGLVGSAAFERLHADVRAAMLAAGAVVRAEAPHFAAFAPDRTELATLAQVDLVTTVGGGRHAPSRIEAAEALAAIAGAAVRTLAGAEHLAHIEAPGELASTVLERADTGASR